MEHLDSAINICKGKTCFDLEARIVFSPVSHRFKTLSLQPSQLAESYILLLHEKLLLLTLNIICNTGCNDRD